MKKANKKLIKIFIIIVCLGSAGAIAFKSRSGRSGLDSVPRGQMIWVKCSNPDCQAEYEVDNKDYWEYVEEHRNPMSLSVPPLICRQCDKKSVFKAVKCEKCGLVFFHGTNQTSYADTCPKCGFSKMKKQRESGRN
jgi:ribosomal protein L37E